MDMKWETDLFFARNFKNEAECMICLQIIQTVSKFNIERHFKRFHATYIAEKTRGGSREQLVAELKKSFLIHDARQILEYIESCSEEVNMRRRNLNSNATIHP